MSLFERVKEIVPTLGAASAAVTLSAAEHDAILELAYLSIAADGEIGPEETEGFRGVVERLRALRAGEPASASISDQELDRLFDGFDAALGSDSPEDRVQTVARSVKTPGARRLAYKLAYALSICDLDASDEEFQFDLTLIDALELSNAEVEQLVGEVNDTLTPGGED